MVPATDLVVATREGVRGLPWHDAASALLRPLAGLLAIAALGLLIALGPFTQTVALLLGLAGAIALCLYPPPRFVCPGFCHPLWFAL